MEKTLNTNAFDVVVVGGSYAGLSTAMALGRSLRRVLVIDGGQPCNRQTPHSHNFLTRDGETPAAIAAKAREQVKAYPTVVLMEGLVANASKQDDVFVIETEAGEHFTANRLVFATGLKDIMPPIPGFAECWGISVLHCPYCHGYEVKGRQLGLIANGDLAFDYVRLIHQWSPQLTLFTHGPASLKPADLEKLLSKGVRLVESRVARLVHEKGYVREVHTEDGSVVLLEGIFSRPDFAQACPVPQQLGCQLQPSKHLQVDQFGKTTVPGVFAVGDAANGMRSVATAVATGNLAGAWINKELIEDRF